MHRREVEKRFGRSGKRGGHIGDDLCALARLNTTVEPGALDRGPDPPRNVAASGALAAKMISRPSASKNLRSSPASVLATLDPLGNVTRTGGVGQPRPGRLHEDRAKSHEASPLPRMLSTCELAALSIDEGVGPVAGQGRARSRLRHSAPRRAWT